MHFASKIKQFSFKKVRKILESIVSVLEVKGGKPFPKDESRWKSHYEFKKRRIRIDRDGTIHGGMLRILITLIDFNFVRELVADCYSVEGGHCYDPVSMFLLELFFFLEGYTFYSKFADDLKNLDKGRQMREFAGIDEYIPSEDDMHNFRDRIGEKNFQAIFGTLVDIFHQVGIITGEMLACDGTLFESYCKYRYCNYTEDCCRCINCNIEVEKVSQEAIGKAVSTMDKENKDVKEIKITTLCPREEVVDKIRKILLQKAKKAAKEKGEEIKEDVSIPEITAVKLLLRRSDANEKQDEILFKNLLDIDFTVPEGYQLEIVYCNILKDEKGQLKLRCPKACKDKEARIGYRRKKENPNILEKVFGYKTMIVTSVEIELKLEIPIMVATGPGNFSEMKNFRILHETLKKYCTVKTRYVVLDSGYDGEDNYAYIRQEGAIPIIDYNFRGEKVDQKTLRERGYDKIGIPFAPCGCTCKSNGYDDDKKCVKFICDKPCMKKENTVSCEYQKNRCGYSKAMSVIEHPRLICEIPRGTKRYKEIKAKRSSSERLNGYAKDYSLLRKPRCIGEQQHKARSILCILTIFLKRIMKLISKATLYEINPVLAKKTYEKAPDTNNSENAA